MIAVDTFAGAGGFSVAARKAGVKVAWAGNHSPFAVETHQLNHPETIHVCQDLNQADWSTLPRYDLLLASPACQPHSSASQPRPTEHHDEMRGTAWAVVECAEVTLPKAILVENVPRFRKWQLYPVWKAALRALGYHLVELLVTASRHGVPQRRPRLFVACTRKPVTKALLDLHDAARRVVQEPAFGPCIDWDEGEWKLRSEALPGAQVRMAAAVANHGPRCLSQHTTNHRGLGLDVPIRTITGQDHWVVVDGDRYRGLTTKETARAMGFRDDYLWPAHATRSEIQLGFGNAVSPPPAANIIHRLAEVA